MRTRIGKFGDELLLKKPESAVFIGFEPEQPLCTTENTTTVIGRMVTGCKKKI
jgi:hypothetical protein